MPNKVYYDIMLPDEHFKPGYRFSIEECTCLIESFPVKKADGYLYRIVCKGYISKPLVGMRVAVDTPVGSTSYPYQTVLLQVLPVSSQTVPSSQIPEDTICVNGVCYEAFDKQGTKQKFYQKSGGIVAAKQQKEPILGVDIPFLNEEDLVQPITR